MRHRVLTAVLTLLFSVGCCLPALAAEKQYENLTDLGLTSKSALLMEEDTGTILYEQNSHEALPPASVTKVMTLLLIYEGERDGKFDWTDTVQVSEHAASMGGSQVFLEEGETQTAADMTKSIAIASANDAAVAMAEFLAGSEEAFVQKMNERAKELGMEDTNFVNACGLDTEGHVSSAYDIALMSRELMENFPEIKEYTTTWQDSIVHKTRRGEETFGLTNTNKLIQWYDGATGLKTGSTGNALYCLSGTAERDGMGLIAVVMAAPDYKVRFREAAFGLWFCQLRHRKRTRKRLCHGRSTCGKRHDGYGGSGSGGRNIRIGAQRKGSSMGNQNRTFAGGFSTCGSRYKGWRIGVSS